MIQPKAIIFKDRKCDWITKQRRVIISTHQSASIREEALQEALKVFPILTKIDDLRRIAKKFGDFSFSPGGFSFSSGHFSFSFEISILVLVLRH